MSLEKPPESQSPRRYIWLPTRFTAAKSILAGLTQMDAFAKPSPPASRISGHKTGTSSPATMGRSHLSPVVLMSSHSRVCMAAHISRLVVLALAAVGGPGWPIERAGRQSHYDAAVAPQRCGLWSARLAKARLNTGGMADHGEHQQS